MTNNKYDVYSIIEVAGYDYVCGFCGQHDYVLRKTEKEAIDSAKQHEKHCHMNPINELCASCSHFQHAMKLIPKEDDYKYGIPETVKSYLRLCNYVGAAVHIKCNACKHYKQIDGKRANHD